MLSIGKVAEPSRFQHHGQRHRREHVSGGWEQTQRTPHDRCVWLWWKTQ